MVFVSSSQIMILVPLLPIIGESLNISTSLLGTLFSGSAIMVGVFALFMGPISDRIGRRKVLVYGTTTMAIALSLHAFAVGFWSLMAVRLFAGAAAGMLSGAAVSFVGDFFPPERRGWANGWIMSGGAAGQIIGIPLGTILADGSAFYMPFVLFAVVMACVAVMVVMFVPQPRVEMNRNPLTLVAVLSQYRRILNTRGVFFGGLVFAMMYFGLSIFLIYLPTWLSEVGCTNCDQVAYMFLVGGVANLVAGPISGTISDKIGRKGIVLFSCLGTAFVMVLSNWMNENILLAFVLFAIAMALLAMRTSPYQSLISAYVPACDRGSMMSLCVSMGQVGMTIAGMLSGVLYTNFGFWGNSIIGAVTLMMAGLMVWHLMPEDVIATQQPTTIDKRDMAVQFARIQLK
jgi:predicted MFS family arabinose efflux permease